MELIKNKEYRNMISIGAALTCLLCLCGTIFIGSRAGLLCLLTGIMLLAAFLFYTGRRYSEIEKLNDCLVRVLAGARMPEIDCQEEGDLSILRTNIYKAATKLTYQNEMLLSDKKQLASAIADISHQLKTPLTSMMMMNDLLLDEEDAAKREEFLRTQSAQLARMNWLIQTLLKLSKLDAGTIVLKQDEVPASLLIEESTEPFLIQMELKNIACHVNAADLTIRCDRNWTVEAIRNIIKNCIEHMDDGGKFDISAMDTNIYSQITIRDTGCGIRPEDLPHIFERFYRGKNAGRDSVGIGLALSRSIIENEHGEILVESTEGEGTTFKIKFYKTLI